MNYARNVSVSKTKGIITFYLDNDKGITAAGSFQNFHISFKLFISKTIVNVLIEKSWIVSYCLTYFLKFLDILYLKN